MKLLPAILRSYREAHPGIEVHIDEGPDRQVLQWLEERRIDVGFVVLPQERFDCFALVEDQMVALIPSQHGLAAKDSVSLAELCDDPFILTEAGSAELVSRLFLAARLSPNIRYRSSQLLSTLETVARGDALTLVAQLSLPEANDPRYRIKALSPPARRQVGQGEPYEICQRRKRARSD